MLLGVAQNYRRLSRHPPLNKPPRPPWDYLLIADYYDHQSEPEMMLLTTEQANLIRLFMRKVCSSQRVRFIPCHEIVPTMEQDDA